MTAKWVPGDDELDAVARGLPAATRDGERVEQERTSVLAQAATLRQQARGARVPVIAGVCTAIAAAAAVVIWLAARPGGEAGPKETITALGQARFERVAPWPDFVVRIDDGRVAIEVGKLAAGERFRASTSDAEIEVRGTQFVVAADHGLVSAVEVTRGRVEIRWHGEPPVFVADGQSWSPPRVTQRDVIVPAPPVAVAAVGSAQPVVPAVVAAITPAAPPAPRPAPAHAAPAHVASAIPAAPPEPTVIAPRPGEAEFRSGVSALRAGDAPGATRAFETACKIAEHEALGEDACFWVGAAAKRAGDPAKARAALAHFLDAFPSSARAGEAAALLGWILYDAGELDAARQRFELAARDRVPKVKQSAERGLEAIRRTRSVAH